MIVNNDCTTITISSDLIDQFVDAFPTPAWDLVFNRTCGCEGEATSVEITPEDVDVQNNTITVSIPVGVSTLTLSRVETNGDRTDDTLCYFNSCGVECDIVELVAAGNHDAWEYFQALQLVNVCDSCTCEKACLIWTELSNILNTEQCA